MSEGLTEKQLAEWTKLFVGTYDDELLAILCKSAFLPLVEEVRRLQGVNASLKASLVRVVSEASGCYCVDDWADAGFESKRIAEEVLKDEGAGFHCKQEPNWEEE